jgi:hypothetical protein
MTDRINKKVETAEQSETTDTTIQANPGNDTVEDVYAALEGSAVPEATTKEEPISKEEPVSKGEPTLKGDTTLKGDPTLTVVPMNPYRTLSMEWVVSRFDAIQQDNEHIHEAFNAILSMNDPNLRSSDPARATAIADVVRCRETTNQQLLQTLEKMYGDLRTQETDNKSPLLKLAEDLPPEQKLRFLRELSQDEAWQPKASPNTPDPMQILNKMMQMMPNEAWQPKASPTPSVPMQMSELKMLIEKLPTEQKQELLKSLGVEHQDAPSGIERTLQNIKPLLDEVKSLDWEGMPEEVRGAIASQLSRHW